MATIDAISVNSTSAPLYLSTTYLADYTVRSKHLKRQQAYKQRAMIRATARGLLAERGYFDFHIQDLATRCGVAVQTLYNNLGTREEILSSSIDELLTAWIEWAKSESGRSKRDFILILCDLIAIMSRNDRKYVCAVQTMLTMMNHRPGWVRLIEDRCVDAYRSHLSELRQAGKLKEQIDIDRLAHAMYYMIQGVMTAPYRDKNDVNAIHEELVTGVGLLLTGATRGHVVPVAQSLGEFVVSQ
jgi:AcrR family transcriptional regulator